MTDYAKMTRGEFNEILIDILTKKTAAEIISIEGAYGVFSEAFNNEVLEEWEKRQEI